MKAHTDLSQSKKLAEILPIESADMYWYLATKGNPKAMFNEEYNEYGDFELPCWSLAALLGILAEQDFMIKSSSTNNECLYNINSRHCKAWSPSLVDAAFEIVCWLKKNGK